MHAKDIRQWVTTRLQKLGPYPSLFVLAIPVAVVEPLKLAAVAIAGSGHWFTGTAVIGAAYAASVFGIHRLFVVVKPKLLELRWFAAAWHFVLKIRAKASIPVRRWFAYR